jgi:molybdenum cofactor cytidylyltransferase/nicotine blue oxidoreductase
VAGAVLAAGLGTRMGGPKAELAVAGGRLLDRAVVALADGGCDPVLAVVRAGVRVEGATAVVNAAPERGMRSSLELAVAAAADADALVVSLVDMPGVGAAAVRAVVGAWRPNRIVRARFEASTGHPVIMSPQLWRVAVAMAGPDEGARVLMRRRPDLVDDVTAPGDPSDLDVPADVERWTARRHPDALG